jgi:hypothetical protein
MRVTAFRRTRAAIAPLVLLTVACEMSIVGPFNLEPPPGDSAAVFLSPSVGSITVRQGSSDSVSVYVTRSHFEGAVDLVIESAPAGVTVTCNPATVPAAATTSWIRLEVATSVAAGSYLVAVRAQVLGVGVQTATLTLVVQAQQPLRDYTVSP